MGYKIPADRWKNGRAEVMANDISAWVELDAGEHGWVPVDVSPDRSRTPPESQGSTTEQIAVPNPPPPPPPPPEVEPPRQEDDEVENEDKFEPIAHEFDLGGGPGIATWVAIGAGGIPLLLFALFAAIVVGWKALRRRRRRFHGTTGGRVAGPWAEAIDRCTESGLPRAAGTTPHETVGLYADGAAVVGLEPELHHLADEVDRATFASQPPAPAHVDRAWQYSDRVSGELRRRRNAGQRMRMRLDPRPLLRARPRRARARDGAIGRAMTDDDEDTGGAADDELVWEVNWGATEDAEDDDVTVEAGDDLIAANPAATGSSTWSRPSPRSPRPHHRPSHPRRGSHRPRHHPSHPLRRCPRPRHHQGRPCRQSPRPHHHRVRPCAGPPDAATSDPARPPLRHGNRRRPPGRLPTAQRADREEGSDSRRHLRCHHRRRCRAGSGRRAVFFLTGDGDGDDPATTTVGASAPVTGNSAGRASTDGGPDHRGCHNGTLTPTMPLRLDDDDDTTPTEN